MKYSFVPFKIDGLELNVFKTMLADCVYVFKNMNLHEDVATNRNVAPVLSITGYSLVIRVIVISICD